MTRSIIIVVVIALGLLAACGEGGGTRAATAAPELTLSACEGAFQSAAAIPDTRDAVEDLDPAVRACQSSAEWSSAAGRFPAALDGVDPLTFLKNRCLYGPTDAPICAQI
jgi:hypothetical protein